jgi:hypothetical protein
MWHGICPSLFHDKKHEHVDYFFLVFVIFIYLCTHIILVIWMRSAYSLRRELEERDKQLFARKPTHGQQNNKSVFTYQSHYNLVAEVDRQHDQHILNQKRQSIFNMATNIDDFETMKNYSKKRRLTTKVKDFFASSNNVSSANTSCNNPVEYANSALNVTGRVAPSEKELLKN